MTVYFVDDGGDDSDGLTWAKAYTSINALDTAVALASGDIVYFGHDHNCQAVNGASLTITGPASGLPVIFISATQGSDPPAYQKGTGTQIDTTEAATYDITFDGSFAFYGLLVKSGRDIFCYSDADEYLFSKNCTFAPGVNGIIYLSNNSSSASAHEALIVDLTQDGSSNRANAVFEVVGSTTNAFSGLTFVNAGFRTGTVFASGTNVHGNIRVSGADFSGFTNAAPCELLNSGMGIVYLSNCKTAATFTLVNTNAVRPFTDILSTNVGSTDDPASLRYHDYFGDIVSSTSIYRSGGATIEGIANSWLVTTTANCNEYAPFHSPWIAGYNSSTGSRTFTLYISNDTGDFDNSQAWLEIEFMATSGSPLYTLASDQRATITTTPVVQDDDTASVWNGAGPTFAFKQKLIVTATVGEAGQFRARVVTVVASIASSRNFMVDPAVFVS